MRTIDGNGPGKYVVCLYWEQRIKDRVPQSVEVKCWGCDCSLSFSPENALRCEQDDYRPVCISCAMPAITEPKAKIEGVLVDGQTLSFEKARRALGSEIEALRKRKLS